MEALFHFKVPQRVLYLILLLIQCQTLTGKLGEQVLEAYGSMASVISSSDSDSEADDSAGEAMVLGLFCLAV